MNKPILFSECVIHYLPVSHIGMNIASLLCGTAALLVRFKVAVCPNSGGSSINYLSHFLFLMRVLIFTSRNPFTNRLIFYRVINFPYYSANYSYFANICNPFT